MLDSENYTEDQLLKSIKFIIRLMALIWLALRLPQSSELDR